ncbi:MAG: DUF4833 domain-containing protein [Desulfocucumaceae bacterium]
MGIALLAFAGPGRAQPQRLFTVSKNTNSNVVCFDALIDSTGCLNREQPIICYWLLAGKDSVKPLNYLERKAYKYKLSEAAGDTCHLEFGRLPQRDIMLVNDSGRYRALIRTDGLNLWLENVHLVFKNRSLCQPIQRVEFIGQDISTGQRLDPGITEWFGYGSKASK